LNKAVERLLNKYIYESHIFSLASTIWNIQDKINNAPDGELYKATGMFSVHNKLKKKPEYVQCRQNTLEFMVNNASHNLHSKLPFHFDLLRLLPNMYMMQPYKPIDDQQIGEYGASLSASAYIDTLMLSITDADLGGVAARIHEVTQGHGDNALEIIEIKNKILMFALYTFFNLNTLMPECIEKENETSNLIIKKYVEINRDNQREHTEIIKRLDEIKEAVYGRISTMPEATERHLPSQDDTKAFLLEPYIANWVDCIQRRSTYLSMMVSRHALQRSHPRRFLYS